MPVLHWFRRDLRLHDNTALHRAAIESRGEVIPVFIFDDAILKHPDCGGPIVEFMLGCLQTLKSNLQSTGSDLVVRHGAPLERLTELIRQTGATTVYLNKDYEPGAVERDERVRSELARMGVSFRALKDHVIYEEQELLAASTGEPFTVYSPYQRAWLKRFSQDFDPTTGPSTLAAPRLKPLPKLAVGKLPTTRSLGFKCDAKFEIAPGEDVARAMLRKFCAGPIRTYVENRNLPAIESGTSRLSPHLRHGTISVRQCLKAALSVARENRAFKPGCEKWIAELIWREFYQQVLFNFPHVVDQPFKPKFARVRWRHHPGDFQRWCEGTTGYPIVDAAMRQLNSTGWMHNRLRMIVAMFLTKDLQIDYRWGERYFANRLIDHEIAQNNGGWQWSSSTGTDAQPYFRIFNPASQSEKSDPQGQFIRRSISELARVPVEFIHAPHLMSDLEQKQCRCVIGEDYPAPMVDHADARTKTLELFKGLSPGG
jgi:deoxyribodipyrimidine photo-lyase